MIRKQKPRELGFGTLASDRGQRLMNPDGTANVIRVGIARLSASDIFHNLTTMSWHRFFAVVIINYTIANAVFAFLYVWAGVENLGITPAGFWHNWLEAFFFSTQCFTTVGFGRVNPSGIATNVLASTESLIGLLTFALATGLLYGRFSRPRAHLIRSKNLIIAPYQGHSAAMFRVASERIRSILIENSVSVSLGINIHEGGQLRRRFFILQLELEKINFLISSWTLVHPINADSPLYGLSMQEMIDSRVEVIVLFKAIDETTSQTVYERFSYFADDFIYGARFISSIGTNEQGKTVLNLKTISDYVPAELPENPVLQEDTSTSGHGRQQIEKPGS